MVLEGLGAPLHEPVLLMASETTDSEPAHDKLLLRQEPATFIVATTSPNVEFLDEAQMAAGAELVPDSDALDAKLGHVPTLAPTSLVTMDELRAAALAARAAAAVAVAVAAGETEPPQEEPPVTFGAHEDSCRLERSNSCSQAETSGGLGSSGELARLSAAFAASGGPMSVAPASTSVSHDNLAAANCSGFVRENTAVSLSSTNLNAAAVANNDNEPQEHIISSVTNVSLLSADLLAGPANSSNEPGVLEQVASATVGAQQEQLVQKTTSSSRFFSSKLNTGSLWSLLSVGSATSSSALNEMPSPVQTRREPSEQDQRQADASSAMTNFFARQFAKRPQQSSSTSEASSTDQTMATRKSTPGSAQQHEMQDKGSRAARYRFNVKYIGSAMLHKNFTLPMLEWIVKDIRRQTNRSLNQRQFTIPIRDIMFDIQSNQLTAISCKDGHCIFVHPMHCVSKYAQLQHDPTSFSYIIRDNKDSPSFCHLFQAKSAQKVHEIFNAIREMTTRNQFLAPMPFRQAQLASLDQLQLQQQLQQQQQQQLQCGANRLQKSASTDGHWKSLLNPSGDGLQQQAQATKTPSIKTAQVQQEQAQAQASVFQQFGSMHSQQGQDLAGTNMSAAAGATFENSYQFEVLFVKRVKLQCRRVPPTFVDDALETLKTFEPPKAQIKGVTKRMISSSVDERQEYDETCQSPTSGQPTATSAAKSSAAAAAGLYLVDGDEQRRGSSVSLRNQTSTGKENSNEAEERESKSCQQSPAKSGGQVEPMSKMSGQTKENDELKKFQSVECLRNIDNTIRSAKSGQAPAYFNDFSPYNTITSSDLNERIAAIPVVSSSVSLDHETRQKLARQVRETIMATAATIKKDVYASGERLDSAGSSKVLDSLSCNAQSAVPPLECGEPVAKTPPSPSPSSSESCDPQSDERRRSSANLAANMQHSQSASVFGNNFDLFRRASARQVVKNRTMLLLIGKDELCAISIDKHQMLFSKSFNSIVHCLQGMNNKDHFGLICRDSGKINPQAESYAGFVFKCQSDKVVREIMGALKQVIYSSQHNYHGYNSPYNPLNYTNTTTTTAAAAAAATSTTQHQFVAPKQAQHQQQLKLSPKSAAKVAASQKAPPSPSANQQAASSLAAKRGFMNPIEIEQAQRHQLAATAALVRAPGPPPSAPALHSNPLTAAIASQQVPPTPVVKNPIKRMFCDDCPLYWFHRLCCDIESLPAETSKTIILRRIDSSLSEREQDEVYSKFSEFNVESTDEHNEIFMSILRQLSERKQLKHNQSQAHATAMAKSLGLARQQSSELLKFQRTAASLARANQDEAIGQGGRLGGGAFGAGAGHQRSGSSGGSLSSVIGQTSANQSLVDASSAAIDNLKRAKNSISSSIENMLKRRSSLRDGDDGQQQHEDELLNVNAGTSCLLARAGSFKGGTRELRATNSDLERNSAGSQRCDSAAATTTAAAAAAAGFIHLKRSQSSSDYPQAANSTGASWRDSLTRTINDDLTNPLVGFFKRRGSFARSETGDQSAGEDPRLDSKRTSTDSLSLACQQAPVEQHSSQHHSPSRQASEQQPATLSARWMQPNRMLGHASPSSYLSGSFWKKSIFDKIHQPATGAPQTSARPCHESVEGAAANGASQVAAPNVAENKVRRSRAELRSLWRKAILEQITLLKMEKQNQKLQANAIECNIERMKLNYRDVPFGKEALGLWDKLLKQDPTRKVHFVEVAKLVRAGVPKQRRGEIWMFLMNQYQLRHGTSFQPPPDSEFRGNADKTYRSLLSQLSTQQHEIFVDIGRTFPAHPYYSQYLSIGQLSLFNLLKAYSLLDKEVGYCQGLSFVAGILLLHVDSEDEAFELMRHLLFNFGLRKQYLPSMNALHLQLYQLTRLLRDYQFEIFEQFDKHDISPSLYAAPWFLTLFASQFPLGFVARLLDLLYLIGIEAIFRVSLTLLAYHRESILKCASLEMTMDFMRAKLVQIDDKNLARIFDEAFVLDLRNKLIEYEIEYSFYCAEEKARSSSATAAHLNQHYHHHHHHHHALSSSRQSANSSSSTVYSDIRKDKDAANADADELGDNGKRDEQPDATSTAPEEAPKQQTTLEAAREPENKNNSMGLTSEVADATATVIIQHLLANNHLRSLRSNYSY